MKAIGIDIGTTTICGILMEAETGEMTKKLTLPNDAGISGRYAFEKLQDPERIEAICRRILEELCQGEGLPGSIGVTGQMHGILYLDREGRAVSPLISWQDERGNQLCRDRKTYAEALSELTGYRLATGFGAVTHYYQTLTGQIPEEAARFCTMPDYIAMRLAGLKKPLLHESMAASLGLFCLETGAFDEKRIAAAGMAPSYFPEVSAVEKSIGFYGSCVPVSPAFGDNQASFLGSVNEKSRTLVNVGTGSQVAVLGDRIRRFASLECRPFMEGKYLYVGSSLCGGYAYAMLERFFQEVLGMCAAAGDSALYEAMNRAGQEAKKAGKALKVDTRFRGTRENPNLQGKIEGITPQNFQPGALVLGVLEGICQELLDFYGEMAGEGEDGADLTGSGNGVRKNPLLQEILAQRFGKQLRIPAYAEEAAYGSALFSLYTAGVYEGLQPLRRLIG